MTANDSVITLEYTPTLVDFAGRLSHLSGFVYLDSGDREGSAELEIVTALPSSTHRLADYSENLGDWMTAIETELSSYQRSGSPDSPTPISTGCVAIGSLDYDAPAAELSRRCQIGSLTTAGIYHWVLMTHRGTRRTQVIFHPDCADSTRAEVMDAVSTPPAHTLTPFSLTTPFTASISKDQYREAIERIQQYILAGDCYQVNFAQRFDASFEGDPWLAYRSARTHLAGGFSAYMHLTQGHAILSLSPERFLRIEGGVITTQPIKGTAPRHSDPNTDAALAQQLLDSEKDRAENIMITDLLRNDLGQFCEPGTVTVTELCGLHSYGNVHHLVSTVRGTLKDGTTPGQLLLASSPGGSITGAPKKRAVEIISELESHTRGAYCGSVFVLAGNGWMQSSIAIRTLEINDQHLHCWGGGGITASSQWEAEYQETLDKVGPIMEALGNGA